MPTNDERREVAKRIRALREHAWDESSVFDLLGCAVEECGLDDTDQLFAHLADLIEPEPEPERTCCNVGGEEWGFKCSECGGHTHGSPFHVPDEEREELAEMLGGRIMSLHGSVPRFCPNCGAKVVDDHA